VAGLRCNARTRRGAIPATLGTLAAINVVNNWLAPQAYPITGVAASGALLSIARWDGCSWEDLGLARTRLRTGLAWAGGCGLAVLAGYALVASVPALRPALIDDRAASLSGPEVAGKLLVNVPLGTVLLEEVAFRGVLYAMLARRYGVRRAILGSSAIFGLWHILPSLHIAERNAAVQSVVADGVPGVLISVAGAVAGTAAGGVVLCELRRRSGSLLAPIGLHLALNDLGYAFAWALNRR